jgi:hypothetical protein
MRMASVKIDPLILSFDAMLLATASVVKWIDKLRISHRNFVEGGTKTGDVNWDFHIKATLKWERFVQKL